MGRIRPIYSESHDHSLFPPSKGRGKRRKSSAPLSLPKPPAGPPPDMSAGFLPKNLSDEQRRELRAKQLIAEREVHPLPKPQDGPTRHLPVPDHDIYDRQDLDVADPRGPQHNAVDGDTVFPEVLGERMDREFMRILSEEKEHPPLPTFDPSVVNASKELIAAVRADDQTILAFDNELTALHTTLRRLRQKAEQMIRAVRRTDDDPGRPDSPSEHANNVVQMITRIIEPWFMALDDEFSQLLKGTEQGEAVEEGTP